jgi:hypothetical protein
MADEALPIMPTRHDELVHESAMTPELELAAVRLSKPYLNVNAGAPAMHDLYLLPNVRVGESGALSGYVATIEGSAPASGVVTEALGEGTTWLRVTKAAGSRIDDDELERAFTPITTASPGLRVSVVSGVEYPARVHYIVVHGNDVETAAAFADSIKKSAATLDDVMQMSGRHHEAYLEVMQRSRDARLRTANEFMRSHSLVADESSDQTALADVPSTYLVHSPALSEAAQSTRMLAKNVYLAYSDAVDPNDAHSGVMVYRGPIAGYTLFKGPAKTIKGRDSAAFSNAQLSSLSAKHSGERVFSVLPADTGDYLGKHSRRAADRHKNTSAAIADVQTRRVKWTGAVRSYNPSSERIMHAPNDTHLISAFSSLGVPPGGVVTSQLLDVVVTQLPALETADMSLEELVTIADNATEETLPVRTGAFVAMLSSYPYTHSVDLSSVFAGQRGDTVAVDVNLLRNISTSSQNGRSPPTKTTDDDASADVEAVVAE